MKFYKAVLFSFVMLNITSFELLSQQNTDDSLRADIQSAKHDTSRINSMIILGEQLFYTIPDSGIAFWQRAKELSEKNLKKKMNKAEKDCYLNQLTVTITNLASYYFQKGNTTEAINYFKQGMEIAIRTNNKKEYAAVLNNLGYLYYQQGDVPKALECHAKSLKIKDEIGDKSGAGFSLLNLTGIFIFQKEYATAKEYYNRAIKIFEPLDEKRGLANSYGNLAFVEQKTGEVSRAIETHHKALRREINDKNGIAISLNNIGVIYKERGDFKIVLRYYEESLNVYEELGDRASTSTTLINIGWIYLNFKQQNKAKFYDEKAFAMAKELGYPGNIRDAANFLFTIYKLQAKHKPAI